MTITGGCLCGAVRYECTATPVVAGHCQCLDCRKTSGSAHRSHLGVPKAAFSVSGPLKGFDKPADSGNMVTRQFCTECGSQIVSLNSAMPDLTMIAVSSLDDPEIFKPQFSVYTSRALSWDRLSGDLQGFVAMLPPEAMAEMLKG